MQRYSKRSKILSVCLSISRVTIRMGQLIIRMDSQFQYQMQLLHSPQFTENGLTLVTAISI
jgi:hypothetical protein